MTDSYEFCYVPTLDKESLMKLQAVIAVILLYPLTENSEDQDNQIGTVVSDPSILHIKQTIENACGTIALYHAVCNNTETLQFEQGKLLSTFITDTHCMASQDRGEYLGSKLAFHEAHEGCANDRVAKASKQCPESDSTSNKPRPNEDNGNGKTQSTDSGDNHFVTFINKGGRLYELDGRKSGPVLHGPTTEVSFI